MGTLISATILARRCPTCVAVVMLLASCAAAPREQLYRWPSYERPLYVMWVEPEDFELAEQIATLSGEIAASAQGMKPLPPGVRAHLGYLFSRAGNNAEARRLLLAEKAAFPESAVFVDGLIARMK